MFRKLIQGFLLLATVVASLVFMPALASAAVTATLSKAGGDHVLKIADDPGVTHLAGGQMRIQINDYTRGEEVLEVTTDSLPFTMAPESLPGCKVTSGSYSRSVECPFDLVKTLLLDLGDKSDEVIAYTESNNKFPLPEIVADLGSGNDTFINDDYGNEPQAFVQGGPGKDRLTSGAANDRMRGGSGNDKIAGGAGSDILQGDAGNDKVSGAGGCILGCSGDRKPDTIAGGPGKDELSGGPGPDRISGGPGNDTIDTEADKAKDTILGDGGFDILYGVDYRKKGFQFKDRLFSLEKIFDNIAAPSYYWTCHGTSCKVHLY